MSRNGILLLGGAGFIGTALIHRLVPFGRPVHVISRKPSPACTPNAFVHVGDLSDPILLKRLREECNAVVHLAASTTPGSSARQPSGECDTLLSTIRLLEVLQDWQDTPLIFLSSGGTVYGNSLLNPVTENTPFSPLSYHAAGKTAIEGFLSAFRAAGHQVTILRPSNTYGPGQCLRQGFGLVRTALQNLATGAPMEIWGDGETVRDFVYVDDVVDAILSILNNPADANTYNVGSGKGHTVNEVLAIAQRVSGQPLQINYHPARSADVREVVLDNTRIRTVLGWQPSVGLEEGIHRTWQWLQHSH